MRFLPRCRRVALAAWILAAAAAPAAAGNVGVGEVSLIDIPPSVGVPYTWEARLGNNERVEFLFDVGAKSWNDPVNDEGSKGWTHMVNWVALELTEPARVKIRVVRQQGLIRPDATYKLARNNLYPAVSVYSGQDHSTEHGHSFNQVGNFWADVDYLGHVTTSQSAAGKVVYRATLPAGLYTIAIGGDPPSLGAASNYPAGNCNTSNATCYTYTGLHGYRALIRTR